MSFAHSMNIIVETQKRKIGLRKVSEMSCVIVLGCYRSGTSAIAGVLHHLGVPMGKQFDPPTKNNVKGYWEDVEFKKFHQFFDTNNKQLMDDYAALIKSREEQELWGLKDPLLCLLLEEFVSNLSCDHKLIVCRRSLEDISSSISRAMDEPDALRYLPLAKHYLESMEKQISLYRGSCLILSHEDTLRNPAITVGLIAGFLSIPITDESLLHIVRK
jgi:hypothetical protein